ncbi:transposase, partial [Lachnospiraceae bacterium PF1-22]|uniref:IS66 family transposase n=1 Tax=Ohessyouella blattaphilus TaxID=2949333 RepID=UPI003E2B1134
MDYRDQLIIDQQKSIENLTNEISALRKEHKEQIQSLNQEIANLNETIRTIAGKRFSPSSESSKAKQIEGQLELDFFNEAEYLAEENPSEPTIDEMLSKAEPLPLKDKKRKARSKREDLFTDLPIKEEIIPLTEDEKVCDVCNSELIPLGKEFVREEIRIIPAKVERVQLFRESYICPGCKEDDVTEIVKSTVPPALLKHSLASASVVSRVMYDKHVNYLPFNRQAKSFERLGVNLSRSVLANWVNSAALLYLQPMFNRLHEELLKREVIMADETPCQVHKEDGRKNTSKSFMWIYRSGEDTLPEIILYDYQISRSGDHPIDFLNGFSGYL